MTGAGRYAPALGNETLQGRMLPESSVHMHVLEKQYFAHKTFFYSLDSRYGLFLSDLSS